MNSSSAVKSIFIAVPYVLIVGGLFLIITAFLFPLDTGVENRSEDLLSENTDGEITEEGISTESENIVESDYEVDSADEGNVSGTSISRGEEKSVENQQSIILTGVWTATDYEKGDITGNTYQVQLGDTLWEISEAIYGDGANWTQLLSANSSDIGFLPNGSQALIIPGQTLIIPSL